MSETTAKNIICPKCSQPNQSEIICSVNTINTPSARQSIFDESIFNWKCKKCGFHKKLLHPLLYNDIENKFMIYYIPKIERRQIADDNLERDYADLSYIKKRIVPDINAFKEKIILFENNINDMALELTKFAVAEVVSKSTGLSVNFGYFSDIDKENNNIGFQFFIGANSKSYMQSTRLEVYNRSLEIVKQYFSNEEKRSGFLNIDHSWAKSAIQKYKNSK